MELKMTLDNDFVEETIKKYVEDLKDNFIPKSVINDIKYRIEKEDFSYHDGFSHWYMSQPEIVDIIFNIIDKCVEEAKE